MCVFFLRSKYMNMFLHLLKLVLDSNAFIDFSVFKFCLLLWLVWCHLPSLDCSPWISLSTLSPGLWSCTEDPSSGNSDWCFKTVSFHLISIFKLLLYSPQSCCVANQFFLLFNLKNDLVDIMWNHVALAFL